MQCALLGAKQVVVALLINMLHRSGIISIVEWLEICVVLRKFYTAQEYEIPQMSAAPRKTSSSNNMQCALL